MSLIVAADKAVAAVILDIEGRAGCAAGQQGQVVSVVAIIEGGIEIDQTRLPRIFRRVRIVTFHAGSLCRDDMTAVISGETGRQGGRRWIFPTVATWRAGRTGASGPGGDDDDGAGGASTVDSAASVAVVGAAAGGNGWAASVTTGSSTGAAVSGAAGCSRLRASRYSSFTSENRGSRFAI